LQQWSEQFAVAGGGGGAAAADGELLAPLLQIAVELAACERARRALAEPSGEATDRAAVADAGAGRARLPQEIRVERRHQLPIRIRGGRGGAGGRFRQGIPPFRDRPGRVRDAPFRGRSWSSQCKLFGGERSSRKARKRRLSPPRE